MKLKPGEKPFAVVSNEEGVAKIFLDNHDFEEKSKDLSGFPFEFEGEMLRIEQGNIVTIPAEIMKLVGYKRKDNRYAVGLWLSCYYAIRDGRYVKTHGIGRTLKIPEINDFLEIAKNGETIPDEARVSKTKSEPREWYDRKGTRIYTEDELAYREHMSEFHGWEMR